MFIRSPTAAYFVVLLGFHLWASTFHVHIIQQYQLNDWQLSLLFALISVPGFLAVFATQLYHQWRPRYLLTAFSLLTAGALIIISNSSAWFVLLPAVLALSVSQVFIYPICSGLVAVQQPDRESAQYNLARMRSFGPLAAIIASLLVIVFVQKIGYASLVNFVAVFIFIFGLFFACRSSHLAIKENIVKLKFDKRLLPYYVLNFLVGSRSGLFRAFVITLLIRQHDFDMQRTSALVLGSTVVGFIGYHFFGWLRDKVQPGTILASVHIILGLGFIGFALIEDSRILVALFMLDSLLFGASVVTDSVIRSFVSEGEIIGFYSTGVSFYYFGGALMTLVGGLIASHFQLTYVFFFAALIAWASAFVSSYFCSHAETLFEHQ